MKITKQLLTEIIEEEINNILSEKLEEDPRRKVSRAAVKAWKTSGTKNIWHIGSAFKSKVEPGSIELFLTFKQGMAKFKDKAINKLSEKLPEVIQLYGLNGTFSVKQGTPHRDGQKTLSLFFKPS